MKNYPTTHNDQLNEKDFESMGKALTIAIAKCERALSYGQDMASSRLLVMRDAKAVLASILTNIDESTLIKESL